jgi:T3SS (YopN, CesT) and YbjN peptide-binding chaperone 3
MDIVYLIFISIFGFVTASFLYIYFMTKKPSLSSQEKAFYTASKKEACVISNAADNHTDRLRALIDHVKECAEFNPVFVYVFESDKNYYIQAAAYSEGIQIEVVNNEYLAEENVLTSDQIKELRDLGWELGDSNFQKLFAIDSDLNTILEFATKTIEIYKPSAVSTISIDIFR